MALLSSERIEDARSNGKLRWDGAVRGDALLVRLGRELQVLRTDGGPVDPYDEASVAILYLKCDPHWVEYDLTPGELVLVRAAERITLPPNLCGLLGSLSHVARLGLMTHLDSPVIDPGTDGHITLELYNTSTRPLKLRPAMPVAKLLLVEVSGTTNDGRYQSGYWKNASMCSRFFAEFSLDRTGTSVDGGL